MCGQFAYACVFCACATCACVEVFAFVCWNPKLRLFHFCPGCCSCIISVVIFPSRSLLCGSHGTTQPRYNSSAHQALPFVTATDDVSVCACACHVSDRNEHNLKTGARNCAGGRAIQAHTSWGFQKQPHSHGYNSSGTTAVQQHQRFKL